MNVRIRRWDRLGAEERERVLKRSESDIEEVLPAVRGIIERVRAEGDAALRALARELDRAELGRLPLRVERDEFRRARETLPARVRSALDYAIENVRRFHEHQRPRAADLIEVRPGLYAAERATPIPSAGLYVPRGRGSFPSMLYMLAIPARIAGVEEIRIVTPPEPSGAVDAACLVAAELCGVEEVYRSGGAQAIAALAYGTESIRPVAKVVGPGSRYVAAAKRLLSSVIDGGVPAGPSESIILADDSPDPYTVALDLMIEAEHGSDSSALLVTPSETLAERVASHVEALAATMSEPRRTYVGDVLSGYGGVLVTGDMEEAIAFVNEFSPEHLQIRTREPFAALSSIRHAGEILLGEHTPFSAANYAIGANAVLPTGGRAKTWSPVSVRDFMKRTSVVFATSEGLRDLAPHVTALADYEGFPAHAAAIRRRDGGPTAP